MRSCFDDSVYPRSLADQSLGHERVKIELRSTVFEAAVFGFEWLCLVESGSSLPERLRAQAEPYAIS